MDGRFTHDMKKLRLDEILLRFAQSAAYVGLQPPVVPPGSYGLFSQHRKPLFRKLLGF